MTILAKHLRLQISFLVRVLLAGCFTSLPAIGACIATLVLVRPRQSQSILGNRLHAHADDWMGPFFRHILVMLLNCSLYSRTKELQTNYN